MSIPETRNGQKPFITGGLLKGQYVAEGVHFHWGSPNSRGAEHLINKKRYDIEMHIVHRNTRYNDVSEALNHPDGIAVLGIMMKIVYTPDRIYPGLKKIFNQLPNLIEYHAEAELPGSITLGQLLGDLNTRDFYSYKGSLTTPDCQESVTWTVFSRPIPIAYRDAAKFWNLLDANGNPIENNYRVLQPRNNRPVFYRTTKNLGGFYELSEEYLSAIRADEETEQAAGEYNYDRQGDDWTGLCQDGEAQSPIDLSPQEATVRSIPRIRFRNYDEPLETPLLLVNNGHTANMVLPANTNGQRAAISGGMLPGVFEAQSVHFHWGSANSKGSEHTFDYYQYDVEIHIVHKNTKYSNMTVGEASMYWDGLAVLGIMLNSVPNSSPRQGGLNKVFNVLPRIVPYQANATITGRLTAMQLTGNVITAQFYTYNGSLTTPDCAESVTWTVFDTPVNFPRRQIMKLWNLRDSRRRPLINNYRELQDRNDRPVYYRLLRPPNPNN
ncbi:hypothetical protein ACLKA7_008558 [Drosophila subpalustris]